MIGRIILWTIAACAAVPAAIAGLAIFDSGRDVALGVALAIGGVLVTITAIVRIVRLNRAYQDHHLAEVLADPAQIVARWPTREHEVILAERGLFLGRAYLPFNAVYQRLRGASLSAGDECLRLEFRTIAESPHDRQVREVPIPADQRPAVRAFVDRITGERSPR